MNFDGYGKSYGWEASAEIDYRVKKFAHMNGLIESPAIPTRGLLRTGTHKGMPQDLYGRPHDPALKESPLNQCGELFFHRGSQSHVYTMQPLKICVTDENVRSLRDSCEIFNVDVFIHPTETSWEEAGERYLVIMHGRYHVRIEAVSWPVNRSDTFTRPRRPIFDKRAKRILRLI